MTDYNFVMVDISVVGADGSGALLGGSLVFQPSDFIWDTSTNQVVFAPPISFTASGGFSGNLTQAPFLAMDNPTLNTGWSWLMIASVPGITVPMRKLTINFANGPEQQLAALLDTSSIVVP